MSVGAELRNARERHNLTLDDISSTTKISVERLNAIEQMDGPSLPPHVYLQGCLRTYATEVRLDPDDIVVRYLDEVGIAPPAPALPPVSEPAPVAPVAVAAADVPPAHSAVVAPAIRDLQSIDLDDDEVITSSGRAFAVVEPTTVTPPPEGTPYLPLLIGAVLAVLVGILISANIDTIEKRIPITSVIAPSNDDQQARRANDTQADQKDAAATQRAAATADPARATPGGSGDSANPPASKASADTTPREAPTKDVTGEWTLTNRVVSASLPTYENLELGFRLQLQQTGNRVTGTGQKLTENGKRLSAKGQSPIEVEGTLDGDRLELRFTERGARRTTGGTIFLDVADAETMEGSFRSDAASAEGTSVARRIDLAESRENR